VTGVRIIGVVLAVSFVAAAAPAAASAAQRFATPTGSGTTCSQASPCGLVTAVNSAAASDEVILAGDQGSYGTSASPIATQLMPAASEQVHGAAGQPMPVIYSKAFFAFAFSGGGTLSDVDIEDVNASGIAVEGSSADHVIAHGGSAGCAPGLGETVIDSVCAGGGSGITVSASANHAWTMTLRNVTAIGTSDGISISAADYAQTVNATNVITRGGSADVATSHGVGGSVAVNLDHSNYATISQGTGTTITPAGSGTNQTATPVFVNSPAGNFHQAPSSPTIDTGADAAVNGTTDFEGKPRTFGLHTDIGADEYAPPSVLSESVSSVTTQSAVLSGSVNSEGGPASARIDYGTSTAYGSSMATSAPALSATPQSLSAAVAGLSPSTTYHFSVVVTSGSGIVAGPDQTFTTATPAPAPGVASCVVPKLKRKRLKADRKALNKADCALGKVKGHRGKQAKVKKQSPKPGTVLPAGSKVNVTLG
jgi:hypothetical protein